jgi:lipopolysaccharide biosynthesis glycosyltransferase
MRRPVDRPLVFCCDAEYAPATLVCLTSVFVNSPSVAFNTYWITSSRNSALNPVTAGAVEKIANTFSRSISIIPIDDSCFDKFKKPAVSYLGNIEYAWLLIPDVIHCTSFLYLDSDIIVQDSLEPLLSLDLGNSIIAGVSDGLTGELQKDRLGMSVDDIYINIGVNIVNSDIWKKERILDAVLDWYARNTDRVRLGSQDIVNVVLAGRKKFLPLKWNTQLHDQNVKAYEIFSEDTFRGIFHFTGSRKPWRSNSLPKYRMLYEKYARLSPLRMPVAAPADTSGDS